jgi:GAF domain
MVVMKKSSAPEPAVMAGEDPRHYAQVMAAVYEATMGGTKRPARPRDLIGESWRRLRSLGVDPEQGVDELAIRTDELERRRRDSGLGEVLEDLSRGLEAVAGDENIIVVADRKGLVLWRSGSKSVLDLADKVGFVEGASWAEENVGTNAIGTALISGRAVQIFSAEHYVRSHHPWTCAGAPIRDPHNGRVLGAIDVSGPAKTVHPTTLALVDAVARLAESHLRELHRQTLDRLRSVAAPMLARLSGPGVAVDTDGWVAAVESIAPQNRILLAEQMGSGYAWLPALGPCVVEALPGGWLLLPVGDGPENGRLSLEASTTLQIDLRTATKPRMSLNGAAGHWSHDLTPRHAEILFVLATERSGLTASALARELFGDEGLAITVRAEMSRLRRHLGGVILAQPYRFDDTLTVLLLLPDDHAQLLPGSCAPAIARARTAAEQPD